MELSELRTIVTALSFFVFVGIVLWAYSGKQKARFDEAANLPFVDADEGVDMASVLTSKHGVRHE